MSNFHVCDWLATVRSRDCRRQAMLSYTQKLPRQLCMAVLSIFLFPAVIAGLSQPRRLLGPVFDDTPGHIHVGLDSGSAVFETKFVRQFPSIIPGLLFCR